MADFNILTSVKNALGITGEYQDETLNQYIAEVKEYLIDSGVPDPIVNSDKVAGIISRGVSDLWNYDTGKLSDYFYQRATQLIYSIESGKYITFVQGDHGATYPINIEGFQIEDSDTVIFSCEDVNKEYKNESDGCILVTFTEKESNSFSIGSHNWTLKIKRDSATITLVKDGILIVW